MTVAVDLPDGRKRSLSFEKGKAVGAGLSQTDGDMAVSATREVDLFRIQAWNERHQVPEAVLTGG